MFQPDPMQHFTSCISVVLGTCIKETAGFVIIAPYLAMYKSDESGNTDLEHFLPS